TTPVAREVRETTAQSPRCAYRFSARAAFALLLVVRINPPVPTTEGWGGNWASHFATIARSFPPMGSPLATRRKMILRLSDGGEKDCGRRGETDGGATGTSDSWLRPFQMPATMTAAPSTANTVPGAARFRATLTPWPPASTSPACFKNPARNRR